MKVMYQIRYFVLIAFTVILVECSGTPSKSENLHPVASPPKPDDRPLKISLPGKCNVLQKSRGKECNAHWTRVICSSGNTADTFSNDKHENQTFSCWSVNDKRSSLDMLGMAPSDHESGTYSYDLVPYYRNQLTYSDTNLTISMSVSRFVHQSFIGGFARRWLSSISPQSHF